MEKVKLAITVDVEEEGLFRGTYPREPDPPRSVAELERLRPLVDKYGIKMTLLVTYPVVKDPGCRRVLTRLRRELGAEIGAHLHPWNTPPFVNRQGPEPHLTSDIPLPLMQEKLGSLLAAMEGDLGERPACFRMGRFDLSPGILAMLPGFGIRVDSSIFPLRLVRGMDSWFLSPRDPHAPDLPVAGLREAPLTMAEVVPGSARAVHGMARAMPQGLGQRLLAGYRSWGAAGPQPTMYGPRAMRLATRLHLKRGGRALTMYFHSSELLAGATPNSPDAEGVRRLMDKIDQYLGWAASNYRLEPVTLSEM